MMKFKKILSQGWRKKATAGQLLKNLIMLMLILYILLELKGS